MKEDPKRYFAPKILDLKDRAKDKTKIPARRTIEKKIGKPRRIHLSLCLQPIRITKKKKITRLNRSIHWAMGPRAMIFMRIGQRK